MCIRDSIQTLFADLESETGIGAAVVTIDSISDYSTGDETFESFATNLFNTWGIGGAERNDGVLVLVSVGDREVRIELGSAYVSADIAAVQEVIDEHMLPSFKRDDYSGGIYSGAQAVVGKLTGTWPRDLSSPTPRPTRAATPPPSRSSARSTDTTIVPIAILGGAIATLAAALGLPLYKRYHKRRCPNCQTYMVRLDKASADTYLDDGQKLEKSLNSVDHDVWECPNCDTHTVCSYKRWSSSVKTCPQCEYRTLTRLDTASADTYLDDGQKVEKSLKSVDYVVRECANCGEHTVQSYHRHSLVEICPRCGYCTVRVSSKTLVEPTYDRTGKKQIYIKCHHCEYRKIRTETLPKRTPQPTYGYGYGSSSSSSSSSSRSSSSGGGRSSGEGASGKW